MEMKLSTAIRESIGVTGPIKNDWFAFKEATDVYPEKACILGCAWLFLVKEYQGEYPIRYLNPLSVMRTHWPELEELCEDPVTKKQDVLSSVLVKLNDIYGWERSDVAGWVDGLGY